MRASTGARTISYFQYVRTELRRAEDLHQAFIPALVGSIGAESYLEFGTYLNDTIAAVQCARKFGVDIHAARCDGVMVFRMTTAQFIADHAATHAPYDLVFIDADHDKDAVAADFFGILPHVSHDGLILLHDTNPETLADTATGLCNNSWEFVKRLHDERFESVTLPFHPGLTIVRNRFLWGPKP